MLKKAAAVLVVGASIATWTSCGSTSSHYLYAALPDAPNQIIEYREDPNSGILTVLSGSPIAAGPAVEAVAVHPSNKFLYAANSAEADISLFTIDSGGALTEVTPRTQLGTIATGPSFLQMDPAGAFLYVGNTGAAFPSVSVFSIDASSGALSAVTGSPFGVGGIPPSSMLLSPSGNVLYVSLPGSPGFVEIR